MGASSSETWFVLGRNVFVDHIRELAGRHPNREALAAPDRRLTYGTLIGIVDARAAALMDALPDTGGVVGISVRDEMENLTACLAVMAAGRRQITLPTFDPPDARQKLAVTAGVEIVLADDTSGALPGMPDLRWNEIEGTSRLSVARHRVGSLLLRTSGSTGDSKLIEFDEAQLAVQLRDAADYAGRRYFRLASVEHGISLRQRLLCLLAGGTNVFRAPEELDHAKTRTALGFDVVELSLMHAEDLIRRPDRSAFSGVTIRMTGSAVSYRMRQQLQERVSPDLYVRYGTSESGTVSMAGPAEHDADEVAGRLSPGVEVEVVDESGRPVAQGARGQIRIRTQGMAIGYLNAPAETAKRFVDGWFVPGDIAWFRADGQLVIAGRSDDMMILNGLNIFPKEIERALELHPAVRAAAALSLDSPVHGQIPVAAVQLEAGADIDALDLQTYAREQLGLRAPRRIIIVPSLPRASDGKLHHRALLASFRPEA
jgi:acyl-CoA synthetase (AMP-forming)/AMP-acid ligase II